MHSRETCPVFSQFQHFIELDLLLTGTVEFSLDAGAEAAGLAPVATGLRDDLADFSPLVPFVEIPTAAVATEVRSFFGGRYARSGRTDRSADGGAR